MVGSRLAVRETSRMRITRPIVLAMGATVLALLLGSIGCSTTEQQQPNIIAKAQGAQNPVPEFF